MREIEFAVQHSPLVALLDISLLAQIHEVDDGLGAKELVRVQNFNLWIGECQGRPVRVEEGRGASGSHLTRRPLGSSDVPFLHQDVAGTHIGVLQGIDTG